MSYEKFKKELCAVILQRKETVGKQVRLMKDINCDVQGEEILCIVWEERSKTCLLQWRAILLYERFCTGGWQSVVSEIVHKLQLYGPVHNGAVQGIMDRMIVRPLNYARNREELGDGIYWRFGDLALMLYAVLPECGEEYMTMKITRGMLAGWNRTDEMLLTNALIATCAIMPPRMYRSRKSDGFYRVEKGVFLSWEQPIQLPLYRKELYEYRLTNAGRINGAVALFYPGVQERLAELFGGDYYVGFASVREAVIYPVRRNALAEIKRAIRQANALCDSREVLSDRVYRYCSGQGRLVEV
jgi:hypothetical protein